MRQGVQAALIEFANFRIFAHHDIGELDRAHDVAPGVGQRLGQEQKLDAHLRALRPQRPQAHHAHVVGVCHDKHRRQRGQVNVPGLAVLGAHTRE
jgi:hypothetical protein